MMMQHLEVQTKQEALWRWRRQWGYSLSSNIHTTIHCMPKIPGCPNASGRILLYAKLACFSGCSDSRSLTGNRSCDNRWQHIQSLWACHSWLFAVSDGLHPLAQTLCVVCVCKLMPDSSCVRAFCHPYDLRQVSPSTYDLLIDFKIMLCDTRYIFTPEPPDRIPCIFS